MGRKGIAIGQMAGIAIAFVVVAVVIAMGADILGDVRAEQCDAWCQNWYVAGGCGVIVSDIPATGTVNETDNTTLSDAFYTEDCITAPLEANITGQGMSGLETLGNWLPTIALVVAAAIVIGIVVTYFGKTEGSA